MFGKRLDLQLRELYFHGEDIWKLVNKHRSELQAHIPHDDNDFNTLEKFTYTFVPMFHGSSITLPRKFIFSSPLNEQDFFAEAIRYLAELELIAKHVGQLEDELDLKNTGRAEIKDMVSKIEPKARRARDTMKARASELNFHVQESHKPAAIPGVYMEKRIYYLAAMYIVGTQTKHLYESSRQFTGC